MKRILAVAVLALTLSACGGTGGEPASGDTYDWFYLGDPEMDREFRCIWMSSGAYQAGLWCYEP